MTVSGCSVNGHLAGGRLTNVGGIAVSEFGIEAPMGTALSYKFSATP